MATLDTRPDTVDISHYGGDTLTITVTAPESLVGGREWSAQIRTTRDAANVDAQFVITPPAEPNGPAYLVLPASECRRLVGQAAALMTRRTIAPRGPEVNPLALGKYSGVWDCQITGPGGTDPVRTLAQGSITIDLDVTRTS